MAVAIDIVIVYGSISDHVLYTIYLRSDILTDSQLRLFMVKLGRRGHRFDYISVTVFGRICFITTSESSDFCCNSTLVKYFIAHLKVIANVICLVVIF